MLIFVLVALEFYGFLTSNDIVFENSLWATGMVPKPKACTVPKTHTMWIEVSELTVTPAPGSCVDTCIHMNIPKDKDIHEYT